MAIISEPEISLNKTSLKPEMLYLLFKYICAGGKTPDGEKSHLMGLSHAVCTDSPCWPCISSLLGWSISHHPWRRSENVALGDVVIGRAGAWLVGLVILPLFHLWLLPAFPAGCSPGFQWHHSSKDSAWGAIHPH